MVDEKRTLEIDDEKIDRLFEEYQKTKSIELRNELVNKYLYIAEIIAKKFVGRGIDYEDLYQVACIALINAVERFEPNKGYKFTSFATPTIMGEIKRYFRDRASIIRLPRRIYETSAKIKLATEVLSTKLKRPPKVEEIAQHLNMSAEEVLEVMEASNNYLPQSLDQTMYEDEEMTLGDVLGKSDENILQVENVEAVKKAIERLSPFEREFVQKRFFEEKTQKEIAEEMNVSQMYISRLEKKVLKKLKDFIEEKKEE
ncbi:RNA polymerase sigma-B factor [Caldicellulosiruptor bescii]|jgi:RNA polymerase sigma-B factor|uniref:RNA polymerase, sigma 28 subunit, Sig B/F/G subfamily n=2 Tax=Caldicellulosiruptor bescii TaxID=31899 RepID=B9MNP0_CALBD|nr:SigB/SigF/SigG family RNA polymerase sigma factor [Caldicellulosiruptor bescii]ACM59569.1 RNA polymerase, sigma 28 subunit, Sig B/F/G subfamily [Caldicellulosiruptor bescii DSM 6725]PBC89597.1 RNA polymerase sigma-B factor [Caldicellulosiruptor bescii]PBC89920.1 RNA polymerase sigma-B factor [Caldicellulosiruptor bescii]PBD04652.1 RNA polymerase sigma-B factor [Caldicellulosiruptor bescii]PBD05716.1 RNA polymerase sigma-B factor [Caldicellulosiruptor bescii]